MLLPRALQIAEIELLNRNFERYHSNLNRKFYDGTHRVPFFKTLHKPVIVVYCWKGEVGICMRI
jgi:hypothetical protein